MHRIVIGKALARQLGVPYEPVIRVSELILEAA